MLSPTKLTVTAPPQPSLAVTRLVSGAGTAEAQLTLAGAGQAIVGAVISLTVIVWVQSAWLPQLLALMLSPTKLTVTAPPQLSLAVTRLVSGAGTAEAQLTFAGAGQTIVGAVISLTVIVCVQSA